MTTITITMMFLIEQKQHLLLLYLFRNAFVNVTMVSWLIARRTVYGSCSFFVAVGGSVTL